MKKLSTKDKNELIAKPFKGSPAILINQAIKDKANLEQLEKLLTLQERWEANEARKAYHRAMTAFKANPPDIEKDKKVAFANTKYSHASLSNVTQKINERLSIHGLSASWMTGHNGSISVTCKITHEQGHSEQTTLIAPTDNSGSKNAIQSIGSTITYLERYTLLALTGLAAHEVDDDGRSAIVEKINGEDISFLKKEIEEIGTPMDKFLSYMGIESLEVMPKFDLQKAKIAIKSARSGRLKNADH